MAQRGPEYLGPTHEIGTEPPSQLNQPWEDLFGTAEEARELKQLGYEIPKPFSLTWIGEMNISGFHRPGFILSDCLNARMGVTLSERDYLPTALVRAVLDRWPSTNETPSDNEIVERIEVFRIIGFIKDYSEEVPVSLTDLGRKLIDEARQLVREGKAREERNIHPSRYPKYKVSNDPSSS